MHEITLHSHLFGNAVIVIHGSDVAYISFDKLFHRPEVAQHGADLIAWFDSLGSENPYPLPMSWVVTGSELEF